ncbi:glycerate kinase type-2 family protein [Tepidiphilus olei]|uniref:glycerate kinase type-2 family protein n=1 Tax=Tepidiphilus olei TaxID=2502184 RepID=UPI00115EC551|nr:glycerate kinase [Tepidiphilus olei]
MMITRSLEAIFNAAIAAVNPNSVLRRALIYDGNRLALPDGSSYVLEHFDRLLVVGAGKGAAVMAQGAESVLGERITTGLVVVKYDHAVPLRRIALAEAAHPVPDAAGIDATARILQLLESADERTLVLCLLTGGASALLEHPLPGLTLNDLQETTALLLAAGANIRELNTVRKHLSAIKGGRLAVAAYPATVLTLVLSDVIGDPPEIIASGPTVADPSTYAEAWSVLERHGLQDVVPTRVAAHLRRGLRGEIPESPKPGDPRLARSHTVMVGNLHEAMIAAQAEAERLGYRSTLLTETLHGDAVAAARHLAHIALEEEKSTKERRCLLAGGETTVQVVGNGKGGRNQHLALAFALEIAGHSRISLLAAGTDGTDGPTDATGAYVDGNTIASARAQGLDPEEFLARCDAYTFFALLDERSGLSHHFRPGPTGTNVMDIDVILISDVETK